MPSFSRITMLSSFFIMLRQCFFFPDSYHMKQAELVHDLQNNVINALNKLRF